MALRLIRKKEARRPTAIGYALLLLIVLFVLRLGAPLIFHFLTAEGPLSDADFVVVEGWLADAELEAVLTSPALGGEIPILATGGPIEHGRLFTPHADFAHLTRDRLLALGVPPDRVEAVPASATRRDRTFASAVALRQHLQREGIRSGRLNLVTRGAHARRSALLFRKALGPSFQIGVVVLPDYFGAGDWWRSSRGFRTVMYEVMAWGYTQVFLLLKPGGEP